MSFEPVAIVGRSCTLPGIDTPDELWEALIAGRDLVSGAPNERWRIDMSTAIDPSGIDSSWSDRGGYVRSEIVFPDAAYVGLDPIFHWVAQNAKVALEDAALEPTDRTQLILANLSYPTEAFSELGESKWFGAFGHTSSKVDARNAKMSGLPATLAAETLGIGEAFSLDAACASALYAIKLAALRLHNRDADAVLVGAVNRADPLFIHHGFCALQAMSKTGQSRPFHPDANGLVPSEGCAFITLKRASDVEPGERVYGYVQAVGLSNDGRAAGFLAPSTDGQVRAIRNAYDACPVSPEEIDFVECHATGTPVGDGAELESISRVFERPMPIGSHKSNFGHAITVAGMIGTLKAIAMFEHEKVPPTIHLDRGVNDNVAVEPTDFDGDAIGINAFGFGGNNAHLILTKSFDDSISKVTTIEAAPLLYVQDARYIDGPFNHVELELQGLRFPPNDLHHTLVQQLVILQLARNLIDGYEVDPARAGFVIGMGCDIDVTRYGARWRWSGDATLKDALAPQLDSAGVIGAMPNIVANRLNAQFDFTGPSFTVSADEASEDAAFEVARDLISSGDLDDAFVGVFAPDGLFAGLTWISTRESDREVSQFLGAREYASPMRALNGPTLTVSRWPAPKKPVEMKAITAVSMPNLFPTPPKWTPPRFRQTPTQPASMSVTPQVAYPPVAQPSPSLNFDGDLSNPFAAHTHFIAQQTAVYQQFLHHYTSAQNLLFGMSPSTQIAAPVASVVPIALPVATPGVTPLVEPPKELRAPTQLAHTEPTALTREQLVKLSRGSIADVWGETFRPLDDYDVVVRMPEPPLLLADRVIKIDAEPASMQPGKITTETDVSTDAWYLNAGRMPAGIMIESGQADLLLVSYLGVDLENQGERAYRLLGCRLTYHDALPQVGETLRYHIEIDGFANHGDVRLFFFHYDCFTTDGRARLSVREGQAGFFTEEELADSGGVLWDVEDAEFDASLVFEAAPNPTEKRAFSRAELSAFSNGDARACFGETHAFCATHTRTPGIWSDDSGKLFLHRVNAFDLNGGPLGRGYLHAQADVSPDDWFFDGHFHNDPCMPGTLMFEGCLQMMSLFLAGSGYAIDKDGWRFEPVPGHEFHMRCRGQCTPESKLLDYELFVEGVGVNEEGHPVLYADLLVTVDGLKAFHCRRMAMRLVPDWPSNRLVAPESIWNYDALRATAIGKPSHAFGPMYQMFDGAKRAPRLPGDPYHFMSRVTSAEGLGELKSGVSATVEYDVPSDAWYFEHTGEMPFAVLLETGLQPCGWLASYVGCATVSDCEVFFRNLDGEGTLHDVVTPADRVVTTTTTLTKRVKSGDVTLVEFTVSMTVDGRPLYDLTTMFGFFPAEALAEQKGLEGPELPAVGDAAPATTDALESPMLRMVDRVTLSDQTAVGTKTFDPGDWFFKAHFFQDPVQPGSLGLEALLQTLRAYAIENGATGTPRVALNRGHSWSYRGQVRPHNRDGVFDVHVKEHDGETFVADGWLFVDGLRIYQFNDLAVTFI